MEGRAEPGLRKRLPVTGAKLFLKLRIVLWGGEDRARVKGTVSRDFRLLVFFMNQFPPIP
jgi:hypothetical protein